MNAVWLFTYYFVVIINLDSGSGGNENDDYTQLFEKVEKLIKNQKWIKKQSRELKKLHALGNT